MNVEWVAWRWTGRRWERVGSAACRGRAQELLCRAFPGEAARHATRFALTTGGVPAWEPGRKP